MHRRPVYIYFLNVPSFSSRYFNIEYSMSVKLLTKHHLEFLSLTASYTGSSESIHVKIPHCWKSHITAHIIFSKHSKYVNRCIDTALMHSLTLTHSSQWRSLNAEKLRHIKGRLLDQAVVRFNCVLFQNVNFS